MLLAHAAWGRSLTAASFIRESLAKPFCTAYKKMWELDTAEGLKGQVASRGLCSGEWKRLLCDLFVMFFILRLI